MYLLTYFQSRDPGIGNFSIPDPGIEKTVLGLQTLTINGGSRQWREY